MNKENVMDNKDFSPSFNGALQTLIRIDELIKDLTKAHVNKNYYCFKRNLDEFLVEAQGFLNKAEYIKAWRDWEKIDSMTLYVDDEDKIVFDSELPKAMFMFSAWLRYKLHKHEVTMANKKAFENGINRLKQKYNI